MSKLTFKITLLISLALIGMTNKVLLGNCGDSKMLAKTDSVLHGTVSGWLSKNYNYIVKSDIIIERGDTLIIEPGAKLNFQDHVRFDVYGKLVAEGIANDSILFTSSEPYLSWLGIRFLENSPAPGIKYCSFRNTDAIDNFRGALSFSSSKFSKISDCSFMNNKAGAIYLKNIYADSILIQNILIKESEDFGFSYDHGRVSDNIKFYNNTFLGKVGTEKGFTGIRIKYLDACKNIDFKGNNLQRCRYNYAGNKQQSSDHLGGAVIIDETNSIQNIKFKDDIISNNSGKLGGVYVNPLDSFIANSISVKENTGEYGGCFIKSNKVLIESSTFKNNLYIAELHGGGGLTISPIGDKSKITIQNSLFELNIKDQTNGGAINVLGGSTLVSSINIYDCKFDSNSASQGGAVSIDSLNSLTTINIDKSIFNKNHARIGNGGVLNVDNVQKIGSFYFLNSDSIQFNSAYVDGGVFNLSNIQFIDSLVYKGNSHGKKFMNFSNSGNGGIGNINVEHINTISIENNKDVFSSSTKNGGAFYLKSDQIVDLNFNGNKSTNLHAQNGGLLFLNCPSAATLKLNYNVADSSIVSGNGGVYSITCEKNLNNLEINNNSFKYVNSINGGVLHFTGVIPLVNGSISIGRNEIADFTSASSGFGGFGYITGNISGNFSFADNHINNSFAKNNGGIICINNSGGVLENLLISGNQIVKSASGNSGGFLNYSGSIKKTISVRNNTIDASESVNNGGVFNFDQITSSESLNFEFDANIIGVVKSKNGGGGFCYLSGAITSNLDFTNNNITSAWSKDNGGVLSFSNPSGRLDNLKFSTNKITGSTSENKGGLLYYTGPVSGTIQISENTINKSVSENDGGGFSISDTKSSGLLNIKIEKNIVGEVKSNVGSGGFLYFNGIANGDLKFLGNKITNAWSKGNGGILSLNNPDGFLNNLTFSTNSIEGSASGNSGGLLYYTGPVSGSIQIDENTINKSVSENDGGGFNIADTKSSGLLNIEIVKNIVGEVKSNVGSGGFLYFTGIANGDLKFLDNKITSAWSKGNGGILSLNNPKGMLNNLTFSTNRIEGSASGNSGGILCYTGPVIGNIQIAENTVNKSVSENNGGGFNITDTKSTGFLDVNIENNIIGEIKSNTGSGGFINFSGCANGALNFKSNDVTSAFSKDNGGIISFNNSVGQLSNLLFSNNKVIGSTSGNNGGLFYYLGALSNSVKISDNTINKSNAVNNGGVFNFIDTKSAGSLGFEINKNIFGDVSSIAGSGGFLCFTGLANGGFSFINNTVKSSSSALNGGLISMDNTNNGELSNLLISGNEVTTTFSSLASGGLFYYAGALANSVKIVNNPINTSKSNTDGGTFYIHNTKVDGNLDLDINNNNKIGVIESTNGAGGFLYFKGRVKGSFSFTNNTVKSSSSALNGGLICLDNTNNGELRNLLISANQVSLCTSTQANGGLLYYNGALSDSVQIVENIITKAESRINGGAFEVNNTKTEGLFNFNISKNKNGTAISRTGSGGFLKYAGNINNKLNISENSYSDSCFAGSNGGAYYIQSKYIKNLDLKSETIVTSAANINGGFLYLNSDSLNSLLIANLKVDKVKAGNMGGLISCNVQFGANQMKVLNNMISGKLEANSGGLIAFKGKLNGKNNTFLIGENTINAIIKVGKDGGLLYFDGILDQNFVFEKNNLSNTIYAGNNGGVIYLGNNKGTLKNITVSENKCNNLASNASIKAANGGFLYITGDYSLDSLRFTNNIIDFETVKTDSAGGLIFFKNKADNPVLYTAISNNVINNLQAGIGGWMFADAGFSNKITFNKNAVKNSFADEGGVLNIVNDCKSGLSEFTINDNTIAYGKTSKGNGAVLNYSGNSIDSIHIFNNTLKKAYSEHFGSFSFKTNVINQFASSNNQFTGFSKDNGGIYHFEGDSINSAIVENDIYTDCKTNGSGAGIYFNVKKIGTLKLESLHINSIEAQKSGGFGCFANGILIKDFRFSNMKDVVSNCHSLQDGGLLYINGTVKQGFIENNKFTNIYSGLNGGLICFKGSLRSKESSKLFFNNNICQSSKGIITGGSGGVLYLSGLNKVSIGLNDFDDIRSNLSGGVVYIDSIRSANFEKNVSYTNKSESGLGGVIYSQQVDTAFFRGNKYNSNTAVTGGTLYFTKGYIEVASDSVYYGYANSRAGGLYISYADGKIGNSCIQNNFLIDEGFTAQGSGIYLSDLINNGIRFTDNIFRKNSGGYGSAVFLRNSKSRFVRNKFIDNISSKGGAIYFSEGSSDSQLMNCLFYQNISGDPLSGSAIMVNPANSFNPSTVDTLKIINSTIFSHNYYGLYIEKSLSSNSSYLILNSILHGSNYQSEISDQYYAPSNIKCDLRYSNVEDIDRKKFSTCIDVAPGMKETSFCLEPFSQCLDAGDPGPKYYDRLPLSIGKVRNDLGITGGPERFSSCSDIMRPDKDRLTYYETIELQKVFEVYPNPATQLVNVKCNLEDYNDVRIEIISLYGQTVYQTKIFGTFGTQTSSVNISGLSKGIYIIRLITENKVYSKQLIII